MRRHLAAMFTVVSAIVIIGCNDQSVSNPTDPIAPPQFALDGDPIVLPQIKLLFPDDSRGLLKGAKDRYWEMIRALNAGNVPDAQKKMFILIIYTIDKNKLGVLLDPNGASPPTTLESVCQMVSAAFVLVKLPAPSVCPAATDAEAFSAVIGGDVGGLVTTGNQHAGVQFPPGALPQTVLVIIKRIFEPASGTPLNTLLPQFPPFYEITTIPVVQLNKQVLVGICVANFADQLQLAHNVGTGIEILPKVDAPFLNCSSSVGSVAADGSLWASITQTVTRLFAPTSLSASMLIPGGLGGLAGSFSPFGAVDPTVVP